jgi:hypothetical protein
LRQTLPDALPGSSASKSKTGHAGEYVRLFGGKRNGVTGAFAQSMYAYAVRHEFLPFRSYTTTVLFDRGTGFIERAQRGNGADAPGIAEISAQGVYG